MRFFNGLNTSEFKTDADAFSFKRDNSCYPTHDISYQLSGAKNLYLGAIELLNLDSGLANKLASMGDSSIIEALEMIESGSLMILTKFKREVVVEYFRLLELAHNVSDKVTNNCLLIEVTQYNEQKEQFIGENLLLLDELEAQKNVFSKLISGKDFLLGSDEDNGLIEAFKAA